MSAEESVKAFTGNGKTARDWETILWVLIRLAFVLPLLLVAEYHLGALISELVTLYWGFDMLTPYSVSMIIFGFTAATTVWGMAKVMRLKPVLRKDEKE